MKLTNLSIYHYRNIEELSFDCNDKINCFVGKNGVGKTNILDSIYFLSFCKSYLLTNDAFNIKHGESSFLLQGLYDVDDVIMKISCAYNHIEKQKIIKCNDKKYSRFSDHVGLLPVVFVTPSDISLIQEGGTERRKFLDSFISMYDREYFSNLLVYNKLLQQRNALLKQEQDIDETFLSILGEKLSILGMAIFEVRAKAIQMLSKSVKVFYSKISSLEECNISYESQLQKGNMQDLMEKNIERDKYLKYTTVGIHRDDLLFSFDNNPIKIIASQGQKKSFILALKFAQYQLITELNNNQKPLLLLDDLFDKLDKERATNIFDMMEQQDFGQIFITDTNKIMLQTFFEQRKETGVFWNVVDGRISKLSV